MRVVIILCFLAVPGLLRSQSDAVRQKGYLLRRTFDTATFVFYFIPSANSKHDTSAFRMVNDMAAVHADTAIEFYFYSLQKEILAKIQAAFLEHAAIARNEAASFLMRGEYNPWIEKYKDLYFHVSFMPVEIEYREIGHIVPGNLGTPEHADRRVQCFGQVIMDKVISGGKYRVEAIKVL